MGPLTLRAESVVDRILRYSPVQPLAARIAASRLRALCYHGLTDAIRFRAQLELLARRFAFVTLADVLAALAGGRALPRNAVLVTFDDGTRSQTEIAVPELDRLGVKAVFFVVLGALDTDVPYWWEQVLARRAQLSRFPFADRTFDDPDLLVSALKTVPDEARMEALGRLDNLYGTAPPVPQMRLSDLRAAVASGHDVGDHSFTHPLLDRCGDERLADEMQRSATAFQEAFPAAPLVYAYPNGNWDQRVRSHLAAAGYKCAFLFDHRLADLADPYGISRLRVNDRLSPDRFETILSGLHPLTLRLRRRA